MLPYTCSIPHHPSFPPSGMAAITTQKKKLQEISDVFCSKAGDFLLTLFDWLLKHKALLEGGELYPTPTPSS
ncbi:hypothetical protein EON64_12650, partial [archaeon]